MKNILHQFSLICLLITGLLANAPSGVITGTIVDRDTHQPLPGANVLLDGTQYGAASDLEGYFEIRNVPVGSYSIRVHMIGYKSQARANVHSLGHKPAQINIALEPTILTAGDIVVTAGYFERVKDASTSVRSVDFEEIRSDPVGAYDILSMMQSLPSVVSGADQTNEIIVRGGSPGENLFVMDFLDIPYPVHYPQQGAGGGPITMVNTEFIEKIDFFAGSFPARYGDKLSSVMDVTVREGNASGHKSALSFDMSGFGATIEGPISDQSTYIGSVKRSFLDLVIQQSGLMAIPKYWTFQGKVTYNLSQKEKLYVNYLGGIDEIEIVGEDSPQNRGAENVGYKSQQHTLGLTYKNLFSQKGYLLASLGHNYVIMDIDAYRVTDESEHDTFYRGISVEQETILKTDLVYKVNKVLETSFGAKLKIAPNTWDFLSYSSELILYGYASDSLQPALPVSEADFYEHFFDDTNTVVRPFDTLATYAASDTLYEEIFNSIGIHGQIRYQPSHRIELTLGARLQYNAYLEKSNFSPRFNASYQLAHNAKVNVAGGRYYQPPFYLMLILGGSEAKALDFYYADQASVGFEYFPREDIRFTAEVYSKTFADMPMEEILTNPNTGADSTGDFVNAGSGRSRGFELFLQKKFSNNWYGTFSYSHSVSEGIDPRKEETEYYPWDYDYGDVVSLIGGYKIRYMDYEWYNKYKKTTMAKATSWLPLAPADEFEISFRLRYSGGKPVTPKTYNHAVRKWYVYSNDDWNTERMAEYLRFDVMILQRFYFEKMNLVAFWDIMNVFNRDNPWDYVYNENGTKDIALQFKTFPIGGITLEF
ncbi:MAG: TonB-dependent receptor [Candidatus Marinimicrobia bacterium]|jgi:outer membrane receptor protein involved in Fe transport|nr:TonB-dependent receptor [Candidatus Neomarinimicrobiota bacterium]MBT3632565.1 TonB-dependent receptor [Candidatus Neomarinimicrobiota bacterium]MBT3824964.1 TonB-dependent receptor [Candidatus Neomarinimicrobiota bacterium]MBT4129124.1 TonB-dependent receptor [Candidatus Neomarinimicrobiota bacterium]MBT4295245.1 TonB-dependent receptor [Candidatus Neomarinimicrobiota bacterium]